VIYIVWHSTAHKSTRGVHFVNWRNRCRAIFTRIRVPC